MNEDVTIDPAKKYGKFTIIKALSERTRLLNFGAPPLVKTKGMALMDIALAEMEQGKFSIGTIHLDKAGSKEAGKEKNGEN